MTKTQATTDKKDQKTAAAAKAPAEKKSDQPATIDEVLAAQTKDDPRLELTFTWEEVKPAYDRVLRQVGKTMKVDGFRPGKVPASVVEERIRRDYLVSEVAKQILPIKLPQALEQSTEKPDDQPNVVITKADKGANWAFTIELPQRTEVKLPEYKKFLGKKKKEATAAIKKSQEEAAAKALKEARPQPPQLDDAQIKARATDEALMALLQEIKPPVSRVLVQRGAQREYERLVDQLGQYQVTWADYLKNTGLTEEMLSQQFALRALENIQMEFILDALMEAQKVTASDDELRAKMAEVMPEVVSEEDKKRQLEEPSVRDYLELVTKRQKLANWLLEL